jgi:hypothetical protein
MQSWLVARLNFPQLVLGRKLRSLALLVIIVFGYSTPVYAITRTAKAGTGNWEDPATWIPAGVPGVGDDVVIPATSTVRLLDGDSPQINKLTVNGTLEGRQRPGGLPRLGYQVFAGGDIVVDGVVKGAALLKTLGAITVNGRVEADADRVITFRMEASGKVKISATGKLVPGVPPTLLGFPGPDMVIRSLTADIEVASTGALNAGRVEGMSGPPGFPGGNVLVEAKTPGVGRLLKGKGAIIQGGAGGAGSKRGNVRTLTDEVDLTGPKADVVGGTVEIFALGRAAREVPGGAAAVTLRNLATGDITAEDGSVIIATCEGVAVDLRGNTEPHIIIAAESVIIETETIFVDPGAPELTSPPDIDCSPRQTCLQDTNSNGIADFCEEEVAEVVTMVIIPSTINPNSKGVTPVAILTTDTFDATTVDPLSVKFGPKGAIEAHGQGHIEDANGDGRLDLVLHFKTQDTGIKCGDTSASLTGTALSGQLIEGSDSIQTVGCK